MPQTKFWLKAFRFTAGISKTLSILTEPSIYYPEQLKGRQLDAFLERGWYRMFQSLFTTHFITEQDRLYRVFWLRYNILSIRFSRRLRLLMQNNSRFSHSIKPTEVNEEVEALYALYKTGIDFDPASSVQQWLLETARQMCSTVTWLR